MKKVLLIRPRFPESILLLDFQVYQNPLGLLMIGSVLKNDYEVEILDLMLPRNRYEKIEDHLMNVDVVGITGHTIQHNEIRTLAKRIKKYEADLPIILGGPHATITGTYLLEKIPEVSYIVYREGEETMPELLAAIFRGGSSLSEVKGISYRCKKKDMYDGATPFYLKP